MEIIISQETNASTPKRSGNAGRRPASAQRSAGGKRPASAQRSASGQRSASAQRSSAAGRTAAKKRRKKKSRGNPLLVTLIIALVLVIGVFAAMGVYVMRYKNYDKILPNVYVAGVDVGGMTKEQARSTIETSLTQTKQQSVNVNLPDKVLTFTPRQDTVLINVDQAVDEAYAYGRSNTNPFTIARAIQAAQRRRNDIDITSAIQVDTEYIHQLIDSTAAEVTKPLTESQVQADMNTHTITVTVGSPSRSLNTEELYNLVAAAFSNNDYSDIDFDYDVSYPETIELDDLYEQLTSEAKDAKYDPDSDSVLPETVGYEPETPLADANEKLAMASAGETLTFNFKETLPELTADELESMLFRDCLSETGTSYLGGSSGRTNNVELACEAIDGTVVQPGEVFSFNDTVGERTAENGYREAIVYVSGKSENELGGGVCQVASTIYYCAMYADLEIVERAEHQFIVDYVPGGLDATVYYGYQDFKFRNDRELPVKIAAYLNEDESSLVVELWGTDFDGIKVQLRTVVEPVYDSEYTDVQIGNSVTTYSDMYDLDGNYLDTSRANSGVYYFHDENIEWPKGVDKRLSDAFNNDKPQEKDLYL